jgi:predicted RNase H-like HicB family nuclease
MAQVTVTYHHEGGAWWAETDAVPRFSAAGSSYDEARELTVLALRNLLGADVDIRDSLAGESGPSFNALRRILSAPSIPALIQTEPAATKSAEAAALVH